MKKQDKERNKEFKNNFNSVLKAKIKDYNLKKKNYMIYTVDNNMIYGLFTSAFISENDLKPTILIEISYKPLWADDLLWDILEMQSNKNEPDSLRVIGAFTMISAKYKEYAIKLENEEISTLEQIIDEELTKFKKIIPSLTESMYIEEIKNSNTIGNVDKSLIYIHENNINEALKIIDKTDGNGRFGVGGKTYKELVREYINKLQSGRKINNKDNTYVEYLNTVVTNLSKTNEDKKRQKTHDIFVSIMIFVPIIISPILIGFNQTLIGILLMIICWGLLFIIGTNRRKNITKGFYKIKDAHTKFNIINVDNENTIKELYEDSALTFMAETSDRLLDFIYNWLNNENVLKSDSLNLYVFDGKLLKSVYDFCKVSNDIKFISIFNKDLDINEANIKKFSHDHFQVKSRWLDDIVNNDKDKVEPFVLSSLHNDKINIIAERTKNKYNLQSKNIQEKLDILSNAEIDDYQFIKGKQQRTYPSINDIFKVVLFNNIELYGIVVNNHISNINGEDQIVIVIFDVDVNPIVAGVDFSKMIIEPQIVSKFYWTSGLFQTVCKEYKTNEKLNYGFYSISKNSFLDEYGNKIEQEPEHLGIYGITTMHGVAYEVVRELIIRHNIDISNLKIVNNSIKSTNKLDADVRIFNLLSNDNLKNIDTSSKNNNETTKNILNVTLAEKADYMIYFNSNIKYTKLPEFFNKHNQNVSIDYDESGNVGIKSNDSNEGINSEFCVTGDKYKDYLIDVEEEIKEDINEDGLDDFDVYNVPIGVDTL